MSKTIITIDKQGRVTSICGVATAKEIKTKGLIDFGSIN
jgi:hypothetical protein